MTNPDDNALVEAVARAIADYAQGEGNEWAFWLGEARAAVDGYRKFIRQQEANNAGR